MLYGAFSTHAAHGAVKRLIVQWPQTDQMWEVDLLPAINGVAFRNRSAGSGACFPDGCPEVALEEAWVISPKPVSGQFPDSRKLGRHQSTLRRQEGLESVPADFSDGLLSPAVIERSALREGSGSCSLSALIDAPGIGRRAHADAATWLRPVLATSKSNMVFQSDSFFLIKRKMLSARQVSSAGSRYFLGSTWYSLPLLPSPETLCLHWSGSSRASRHPAR
jgi:hypothetical protein